MNYYHDSHIHATDYYNNDEISIVRVALENERDLEKYGREEECEGFLVEITSLNHLNHDACVHSSERFFTEEELVEIIQLGVREFRMRKQQEEEWEAQHEENSMTPEEEEQALYEYYHPDFEEVREAIRLANKDFEERNR